jgi:DNA-binding response OmpR family regulator
MRILVVEDEFNLADVIKSKLEKEKYVVDISTDGEDGLYNALTDIYDLIILDVMLPEINGFEVLREIRKKGISSKVIMLTAKSTLEDKLNGFEKGANDYITKPFHVDELLARVNAQLKISIGTDKEDVLTYGDLSLDLGTSELTCTKTNDSVGLVRKEFQIISYLMNNPNRILSKEQIYDKVWGIDNDIESNNLEAYLSFARKKLKAIGSDVYIKAARGMGYKMGYEDE